MTTEPRSPEPTNAELIASAAGIAFAGRGLIESTDRASRREVGETLDALHEHLAVAGGSLLVLADWLGLTAEVEAMLRDDQVRVATFQAFAHTGGKA